MRLSPCSPRIERQRPSAPARSATANSSEVLRTRKSVAGSKSAAGPHGAGGAEEHEAGEVVGVVGDRRRPARPGRSGGPPRLEAIVPRAAVAGRGDVAGRDPGIEDRHPPHVGQRAQEAPALGQHDRVRVDLAQPFERRTGQAEQFVLHAHGDLGQQVQLVLGQRVVAFADRAGDGVVDRQQSQFRPARQHRVGDGPVRGTAQRRERDAARGGVRFEHGVRVRSFDAFEGGAQDQLGRGRLGGGTDGAHRAL